MNTKSAIRLLLLCWLPVLCTDLRGQDLRLQVLPLDTDSATLVREVDWPAHRPADTAAARTALTELLEQLRQAAYWEASIDTIIRRDSRWTALLHRGPRYRWSALLPHPSIPRHWLSRAGYRPGLYADRPLAYSRWTRLQDRLLLEAAAVGYPLARVYLDSIRWSEPAGLSARIRLDKGPFITLEAIEIPEDARISSNYIEQYTGLRSGAAYNEKKIRQLPDRLRELPFVQLEGEPSVRFIDNYARLQLPLNRRRASRFDFIIGVLPNSAQTGRLLITGELEGELSNGFGQGERIAARFEQLRPQTQELDLAMEYPYLLGLPFGLNLAANFYRRDTQYLDLNWRAGAAYLWSGANSLEVFWARQQTNLLGFDSARVIRLQQLPDTLDVSRSSFGLAYSARQVDYRFNPRRGWSVRLAASAGSKRIRRNNRLLAIGAESLYDSLTERSAQYRIEGLAEYFIPLFSSATLRLAADGGAILGGAPVLVNEQYRLGGARRLRGFDEQSLFATRFAIGTVEFRYLLGQNSYFNLFADAAWLDRRSLRSPPATDYPLGFGAGITFETGAGLFGLSLAFGRQNGAPIDFGAPKVHLGYVSLF